MEPSGEQLQPFHCSKCGGGACEVGEFRAAGGFWSKIFNVQSQKFATKTCTGCGLTEVYKKPKASTAENVLDFLVN